MRFMLILVLIGTMVSCSKKGSVSESNTKTETTYPWNAFSIATTTDLPTCSGDIVGRLYYVEDTNLFKVCKSTGWTTVNIQGAPGNNGSNGTNGITISTISSCFRSQASLLFEYNVITYTTGDKFVFCSLSDSLKTISGTRFWSVTLNGATTASCSFVYDLDTATFGSWYFTTASNGTKTAIYQDTGSSNHNSGITFASTDCTNYP